MIQKLIYYAGRKTAFPGNPYHWQQGNYIICNVKANCIRRFRYRCIHLLSEQWLPTILNLNPVETMHASSDLKMHTSFLFPIWFHPINQKNQSSDRKAFALIGINYCFLHLVYLYLTENRRYTYLFFKTNLFFYLKKGDFFHFSPFLWTILKQISLHSQNPKRFGIE